MAIATLTNTAKMWASTTRKPEEAEGLAQAEANAKAVCSKLMECCAAYAMFDAFQRVR